VEENWKLEHVGIVVRDVDKSVEYYKSLGINRFRPVSTGSHKTWVDFMTYGKPADPEALVRIAWFQIGSTAAEFLQPVEGNTPWQKSLDTNGEGIQHMCFLVDDLDEETAKMIEKGATVIHSAGIEGRMKWAYFDTLEVGNTIIELKQLL